LAGLKTDSGFDPAGRPGMTKCCPGYGTSGTIMCCPGCKASGMKNLLVIPGPRAARNPESVCASLESGSAVRNRSSRCQNRSSRIRH